MTPPENGKPLWNESRVETLLEEFFQKEMPPALRGENPSLPPRGRIDRPAPRASSPSSYPKEETPKRANSFAGVLVVGFSSLMMLMVALILWEGSPSNPRQKDSAVANPESEDSSRVGDRSEAGERQGDPLEALKHDGQGPVESRPRIRHVGTDDPSDEKSEFPELDIEVFPLDRDSQRNDKPEHRPLPESKRPDSTNHPMPEEKGARRENPPPPADDPDEFQTVPQLPELRSKSVEPPGI